MKKYLAYLTGLSIIEIALSLYLTFWREDFWQAISLKEPAQFIYNIIIFTIAALAICAVSGLMSYYISICSIKWREKLTLKSLSLKQTDVENYAQRIQEDTIKYPTLLLTLIFGLGKALLYILVFSAALLYAFHWWYLLALIAYTVIGTYIAQYIAKPLISLNYESQRAEATYRQVLSNINFKTCISILFGLAYKQKYLSYFQNFFTQVGIVLPILLVAPEYFGGAMTIGLLMRFSSTTGSILDNLSYGVNSFGQFNEFLASKKRLKEVGLIGNGK